jgi:hypothetical protein
LQKNETHPANYITWKRDGIINGKEEERNMAGAYSKKIGHAHLKVHDNEETILAALAE